MRRAATSAAGRSPAAERPAHVHLRGHRERVGQQREQAPQPVGDLLPGQRHRAEPGGDRRGGERHQRRARWSAPTAGARPAARRRCRRARAGAAGRASAVTPGRRPPRRAPAPRPCPTPSRSARRAGRTRTTPPAATFTTLAPTAIRSDVLVFSRPVMWPLPGVRQVQERQAQRGDPDVAGGGGRGAAPAAEQRRPRTGRRARPPAWSPRPSRRRPRRRRRPRARPPRARPARPAGPPRSWWRRSGRWPARPRSTGWTSRWPARRAARRPRCPTMAVSTRLYSGSAAIAPSAGMASRAIRRSRSRRPWLTPVRI